MKTKAEMALAEQFEAVAAKLPGGKGVGVLRRAAMAKFQELGLPHRRVEEWKYTDLRAALKDAVSVSGAAAEVLAPDVEAALGALARLDAYRVTFVNGQHVPGLSRLDGASGLEVMSLAAILAKAPDAVAEGLARTAAPAGEAVVALNTALMTDGAIVRISAGAKLDKPLLLISLRAGAAARLISTRHVISAGAKAEAVIIDVQAAIKGAAGGQTNTATEMTVGEHANVTHIKWTSEGADATHLASWMPKLAAGSVYRAFLFTADTALARNQLFVTFDGEGAKLDISGAFLGRGGEHVDTTMVIDHAVPACESRELYKVVLADRARGVFQGKVIVRPDAQKTDGKQMSQALMLSEDAEFDSKPELEIFADDVVCGHGATSAEIDSDMMFYLASRGIPKDEARALLIEAFIGEVIEKVEHEAVRDALRETAGSWLKGLKA
jgi:Fe-S cluster assembly protein SufD